MLSAAGDFHTYQKSIKYFYLKNNNEKYQNQNFGVGKQVYYIYNINVLCKLRI